MYRFYSILFIIIAFISFSVFDIQRKSLNKVLNVRNASEIEVDLNNNKIFDTGELICIENVKVFSADLDHNNADLMKNLKLSKEDSIKIGYFSDNFADDTLTDKLVKVKLSGKTNQNCRLGDIILNKQSYRNKLISSGFGIENNKTNENFQKQLEKAKKLDLVILNHRSNKFHKLDCKYGQIAHDAVIIAKNQIPKDSKPCKFCHVKQEKSYKTKVEPVYPLIISNGYVKMFLTDLTLKLKPDKSCSSSVCQGILSAINQSKNSIDIAIYGWDNVPDIYNALLKAKNRGVKIREVYDVSKKSYYPETGNLLKLADEKSADDIKFLMHNKFLIIDNRIVITGSMNFSQTGFSGFNTNCVFIIDSDKIAKIYEEEFNQMLKGKFHSSKSNIKHETYLIGNSKITPLFSPKDKIITNKVIPMIDNAKLYIYIPAFIITHEKLANSLINAKQRGVDVKIIVDATNVSSSKSKIKLLRTSKVPVKVENYAGKVHSKTIIIDDKYLIAGSMNFTNSGENKNDENCLIVEDSRLAKFYKGFFEYLWKKIPDKYLEHNVKAEGKNSIGSCYDGIDNDFDGKIDMQDEACRE